MRFPLHITTDMVAYQLKQSLRGQTRYPFVLMLEPSIRCNLACIGCSTERHTGKLADRLPVETCLQGRRRLRRALRCRSAAASRRSIPS